MNIHTERREAGARHYISHGRHGAVQRRPAGRHETTMDRQRHT